MATKPAAVYAAEDPKAGPKRDARRWKHVVHAMSLLIVDTARHNSETTRQLHGAPEEKAAPAMSPGPRIGTSEWAQRLAAELQNAHIHAASLGRRLANRKSGPGSSEEDVRLGREAWEGQKRFFQSFVDDVINGRYTKDDGTLNVEAIDARADLYAERTRGTANGSWLENQDDDSSIEWVLGGENHCADCPELADNSPYTKETLYTVPGACDTECLTNCGCHLEVNGQMSL